MYYIYIDFLSFLCVIIILALYVHNLDEINTNIILYINTLGARHSIQNGVFPTVKPK